MEKILVNINGKIVNKESANVSIFDRGFLYGDSIYEVTMTYKGIPFLLDEHFDRLWASASKIGLDIQWTRDELLTEIQKGLTLLNLDRVYIRLMITRGSGEIGLDPALASNQSLFIIYRELPEYPSTWYEDGVSVIIADIMRNPKNAIDPSIKSGNYLNNVLAMKEAKERGAFDAIMLDSKGNVTEATTSNIWIVKDGIYLTPPLETGLLSGITRRTLLDIGAQVGFKMREVNFNATDLKSADEVFFTASTKEIVPIVKVDDVIIGNSKPGKMTKKLHEHYKNFVNRYIQKRSTEISS